MAVSHWTDALAKRNVCNAESVIFTVDNSEKYHVTPQITWRHKPRDITRSVTIYTNTNSLPRQPTLLSRATIIVYGSDSINWEDRLTLILVTNILPEITVVKITLKVEHCLWTFEIWFGTLKLRCSNLIQKKCISE